MTAANAASSLSKQRAGPRNFRARLLLMNGGRPFLRYFFHLNCGSGSLLDDLGREFDSHASALAHALKLADTLEKERFGAAWERYVTIADETGEEAARVFVAGSSRIEIRL